MIEMFIFVNVSVILLNVVVCGVVIFVDGKI